MRPTPKPPTQRIGFQSTYSPGGRKAHARQLALGRRLLERPPPSGDRGPAESACRSRATKLIPSAEGRIEHLLVTVPRYEDPAGQLVLDPRLQDNIFGMIGHLGSSVRHTVVCQFEQEDEIRDWLDQLSIPESQVDLVLSKYAYTEWAQDAYLALEIEGKAPVLCEGVRFLREDDMVIADDVAAQTDVLQLHSILEFQGGNFLGGSESHFLGRDYVEWNVGRVRLETPDRVVREFELLLGGKVHVIGLDCMIPEEGRRGTLTGHWQPIFHIDMYVTRTGLRRNDRELVLVGSPREARRLLDEPTRPDDQDEYFDQAADQLRALGFEVNRIPLLRLCEGPLGWQEQHYVLTWNNAVVENYVDASGEEIRQVLLPKYSDPENRLNLDQVPRGILDAAATEIWEDLGFQVLWVDQMEHLAYAGGSLHCITKVLQRGAGLPR